MSTVRVGPLPLWMPIVDLLGPGDWRVEHTDDLVWAEATVDRETAAHIMARLRGLAFDGLDLQVRVRPALKRAHVRAGRTLEARAHRDTTPGFTDGRARLDAEGRRSLTPEALALDVGALANGRTVLDLTCGSGGNAIGFARAGSTVVAVEIDPARIEDARFNAALYGVADKVHFQRGDARDAVTTCDSDLVFIDPPWAGWDHRRTVLSDLPLLAELLSAMPAGQAWWAKVPPSFVLAGFAPSVTVQPLFGRASGDQHRVKFLLIRHEP